MDVIVVDVDHASVLVDNDFVVGRILIYVSLEISMKNSDSFFDLFIAGFLPVSLVKLFSIARGLNFTPFMDSFCIGNV